MPEMNPQCHCSMENCKTFLKAYLIFKFRWHDPNAALGPLVAWVKVKEMIE